MSLLLHLALGGLAVPCQRAVLASDGASVCLAARVWQWGTSMSSYERVAIYYTPEPGSNFAAFGRAWLRADDPVTARPARYGLHGTLKAPFRLAEGMTIAALQVALDEFAQREAEVEAPPLALVRDHGFLALRPSGPSPALGALAGKIVGAFEPFRAPLSEAEIERRLASGLSPADEARLRKWGYPYVFEGFHFHITLSAQLEADVLDRAAAELEPRIAQFCREPFRVTEMSLLGDPGGGAPFEQISRHLLRAS